LAPGAKRRVEGTRRTEPSQLGYTEEREYRDMEGVGVLCLFCGRLHGGCWVMNNAFIMCKIHFGGVMHKLLELV
jgi:hypothetical protein